MRRVLAEMGRSSSYASPWVDRRKALDLGTLPEIQFTNLAIHIARIVAHADRVAEGMRAEPRRSYHDSREEV